IGFIDYKTSLTISWNNIPHFTNQTIKIRMKNFYFNRANLCLFSRDLKGKRIKIPKHKFLMFLLLFPFFNLYSQQINVVGIVQSSKDNLALLGATISLEGSSVSTVSDEAGEFSFYSPNESGIIVVKYVGYK